MGSKGKEGRKEFVVLAQVGMTGCAGVGDLPGLTRMAMTL